jgi:hypothetical protein
LSGLTSRCIKFLEWIYSILLICNLKKKKLFSNVDIFRTYIRTCLWDFKEYYWSKKPTAMPHVWQIFRYQMEFLRHTFYVKLGKSNHYFHYLFPLAM